MTHSKKILAIETSCDETAAAVIENGTTILSNVVASQMDSHKRFGGVVPEVASRHHVEQITRIIDQALVEANVEPKDLAAIAVTEGPGLVGALLVGVHAAKAMAFAHGLPLIGVHHIAGHIYANQLMTPMTFPLMALVVSGGHTELIHMQEDGHYETVGMTRDDAVGEAYDKVARTLGLPYPGGPHIDRLAHEGQVVQSYPRSWLEKDSLDFSFSGLKSHVLNVVHNHKQRGEEIDIADVAASFQESVKDVLVTKTRRAVDKYQVKQLVVAGGVAANKGLRSALEKEFAGNLTLAIPPLALCTDNAAMIGAAAYYQLEKGSYSGWDLNGRPGLELS